MIAKRYNQHERLIEIQEDGEKVFEDKKRVDRSKISQSSRDKFVTEEQNFEDGKSSGDMQKQLDALNAKINDLFHVVSGKTVDEVSS